MRIDIDALTVETAGARLVDEVTLTAREGQLVGLVGPNGSGKSTLLRCVYRALRPTSGAVRVGGDDITRVRSPQGRMSKAIRAVPQGPPSASSSRVRGGSTRRTTVCPANRLGPTCTWYAIDDPVSGQSPRSGWESEVPTTHSPYNVPSARTDQTAAGGRSTR
ncbi:ABC transporter ATP-binding protein [Streptomyces cavourensis]|nr:ABC transporter ATP-binding protein [Streptomyces cavourensis]